MTLKRKISKISKSKKTELDRRIKDYSLFLNDDADYDWYFIIRILRFKLERMQKHFADHSILSVKERKKIDQQIGNVLFYLKKVEEDNYFEELHKPFWKKYGKPKMITGKPNEKGLVSMIIRYSKETPKNRKQIVKESIRLLRAEDRLRRQDLAKAFRLMEKNIWNWWD